jgi:pimeloyl-ACP methyl ester carboxylesterase
MKSRRLLIIGALFILLFVALASSNHVRIGVQSVAFLVEVFPESPVYPGRWFVDEPERLLVQFPHGDESHGAFLYRPANKGCYGGIVMYIGLGPEHGDSHLDRISRAFARNGVSVLIPVSEPMVNYRLDADEHLVAASAFEYLQGFGDVDENRVGMFGISVGGAVVANAAQEDRIRGDVAMIHSLGGYYDASTVLSHMSVQAYEVDGIWIEWEPSPTTYRATRNSIVPLMPSEDRVVLWGLFSPDADEVPPDLTEEGEALAQLLANRDVERIDSLAAELPVYVTEFLQQISPAGGLERIDADILLLHDRFDHVLPYSESVRFAADAEATGHDATYLTVLEQFHHVRPDEESDRLGLIIDGFKLYRHIYRMHRSLDQNGWFRSPLDLVPFVDRQSTCT